MLSTGAYKGVTTLVHQSSWFFLTPLSEDFGTAVHPIHCQKFLASVFSICGQMLNFLRKNKAKNTCIENEITSNKKGHDKMSHDNILKNDVIKKYLSGWPLYSLAKF